MTLRPEIKLVVGAAVGERTNTVTQPETDELISRSISRFASTRGLAFEAPAFSALSGVRERMLDDCLRLEHAADELDAPTNVRRPGQPWPSIPCQRRGSAPSGLLVVGRQFDDATVLPSGAQIEEVVSDGVD